MSKLWIPITGFALCAWLVGGTIWYKHQFCMPSPAQSLPLLQPSVSLPALSNIDLTFPHSKLPVPAAHSQLVSSDFEFVLGKSRYREVHVFCVENTVQFKESEIFTAYLRELKSYLIEHPTATVSVTAHADVSEARAIRLAADRTIAMQVFLLKQGFEMHQLQLRSAGVSRPIAMNNASRNARIEVKVLE
ncbi:MAG: hypothetical protein RL757_2028 [Bacteroidota bacterium]|jgi:hypothetical protein